MSSSAFLLFHARKLFKPTCVEMVLGATICPNTIPPMSLTHLVLRFLWAYVFLSSGSNVEFNSQTFAWKELMAGSPCTSRKMSGHQRSVAQAGFAGRAACSCVLRSQNGGLEKHVGWDEGGMRPCAACKPLLGASQMGTASHSEDL